MNFTVGDKVEFIGRGSYPQFRSFGFAVPVPKTVYTIREIRPDPDGHDIIGLLFNEIRNPTHPLNKWECAFCWSEFRKVIRRKTDISIFTKMLNPNHTKELVV